MFYNIHAKGLAFSISWQKLKLKSSEAEKFQLFWSTFLNVTPYLMQKCKSLQHVTGLRVRVNNDSQLLPHLLAQCLLNWSSYKHFCAG